MHTGISLGTKFHYNQFYMLGQNLSKREISGQKQSKFHFKQTILNVGAKFGARGYFKLEKEKSAHDYWIPNWSRYQILAETKNFELLNQICQKSVFAEKVSIIIELHILELG